MVGGDIYRIVSYRTPDQPGRSGLSPFPWHLSLHLGLRYTRLYGRWWYIVSYRIVHLINLDGVGYLPSHDISHFIWDSDILGSMVGDDISYRIVTYRTPDQPGWRGLPPFPWHLSLHLGLRYTRLCGRWWYIVSYRIISYRTPDQPGWCGLPPFPWHLSLHLGLWYTRLHGRWWYTVYRVILARWKFWLYWRMTKMRQIKKRQFFQLQNLKMFEIELCYGIMPSYLIFCFYRNRLLFLKCTTQRSEI